MGIKDRKPSMHLLSGRGGQLDPEPEIQSSQAVLAPIAVGMASRWCLIFGKYEAFSRTALPVNGYLRTAHNRPQTCNWHSPSTRSGREAAERFAK
jgi:hypothetical protein